MTWTTILIILLLIALFAGALGNENYGWFGWSPAGVIVLILVILWLTGGL